jgi:hypothetical protein
MIVGLCVGSASPAAALPPGGYIHSSMNNKCLEITAFNPDNGATVGMYPCIDGANQKFFYNDTPGHGGIRSSMNGKCLELLGFNNNDGARVGMWDCVGGSNQLWDYEDPFPLHLKNRFNGKCLDLLGFNNDNFAPVGVWQCNPEVSNQRWY